MYKFKYMYNGNISYVYISILTFTVFPPIELSDIYAEQKIQSPNADLYIFQIRYNWKTVAAFKNIVHTLLIQYSNKFHWSRGEN